MRLYLSTDLNKAPSEQGEALGGQYLRRVVTGTTKDGRPQYRYLRTKEEVAAYDKEQKHKKKKDGKDEKEKETLEDKLSTEQKESKRKLQRDPTLLLQEKEDTKKSLPLYLEE